jgi:TRAP-type C4-dicarboxylate transport system permease small subunit
LSDSKQKTDSSALGIIEFLLKWLGHIFNNASIFALIGIILVVLYQIIARVIPWLDSPVWTVELSRFLYVYTIIFASGAVIIANRHIRLDLFQQKLPERLAIVYNIVCHLLVAAFAILLLKFAWEYVASDLVGKMPALFKIKLAWVKASTIVFFVLVSISSLLIAARDVIKLIESRKQ